MRLKSLQDGNNTVHVVYTGGSNLLELTLVDKLKEFWSIDRGDTHRVETIQKIRSLEKSLMMSPLAGEKWFVYINMNRLKRRSKDIANFISVGAETSVFYVATDSYGSFKELKKELRDEGNFLYLGWLRETEIHWLVDDARKGREAEVIAPKALDFLSRGYGSEPDKVMRVCELITEGTFFGDRKSIIDAVGVSAGSVDRLVFNLLKEPPKNVKLVVKNRLGVLDELLSIYGVRTTQNYLKSAVRKLIDLKMLWLNGTIYNRLPKNLPQGYVYEELKRYERYLDDLRDVPLKKLVALLTSLEGVGSWRDKVDAQGFIYKYYTEVLV